MNLLAIDTAGPRLQIALLKRNGEVDVILEDLAKGHAEILFDRVAGLLSRNSLAYRDIDRFAVTTGPGSFTGLRIGVSAVRGFALALGRPAVGVPTHFAISLSAPAGKPCAVLLDARRGQSYVQLFNGPGAPVNEPCLLPTEAAEASIPAATSLVLTDPAPELAKLARFAADCDPTRFPPVPAYVRDADAKPQQKAQVALLP